MAESKIQNFNHLKIHSQYSICEGAIKIDDLKEYAKENNISIQIAARELRYYWFQKIYKQYNFDFIEYPLFLLRVHYRDLLLQS